MAYYHTNIRLLPCLILLFAVITYPWLVSAQLAEGPQKTELLAVLSGTILDPYGVLAKHEISIFRFGAEHGHPVLLQSCTTITSLNGDFRCERLLPGLYFLAVNSDATIFASRKAINLPVFSFYGGTGDLDKIIPIVLQPGDFQSLTIALPGESSYRIKGKIPKKFDHSAIRLFAVASSGLEYPVPAEATYDSDRGFVFDHIPAGRYVIKGDLLDADKKEVSVVYDVTVADEDITDVELESFGANVRVSIDGFSNWSEASSPLSVNLEDIKTGLAVKGNYEQVAGMFSFQRIPPGDYLLNIGDPEYSCIDSIVIDGREYSNPFHVTDQQTDLNIAATVRPRCALIRGTLESVIRGEIILVTNHLEVVRVVNSDATGNFAISGVAPGSYQLFAWPSTNKVAFRDPKVLTSMSERSISVEIPDDGIVGSVVVTRLDVH